MRACIEESGKVQYHEMNAEMNARMDKLETILQRSLRVTKGNGNNDDGNNDNDDTNNWSGDGEDTNTTATTNLFTYDGQFYDVPKIFGFPKVTINS